jgi:DnaJ-class molecular chaperone
MKLPLYHGCRTNKSVRRSFCLQKNRDTLSTHYTSCEKCNGEGEVTCDEKECPFCDEKTRNYCISCHEFGFVDFTNCDSCYGTGISTKTKTSDALLFVSDNKRKVRQRGYMRCFDCGTRICKNVIWMREKTRKLAKQIIIDDLYYYND